MPITVPVPTSAAEPAKHEVIFHFRWLEREPLKVALNAGDDLAFFKAVLVGFEGIADHSGEPLDCNDDNLEALSRIPYFAKAVVDNYLDWHMALPLKN